MPLKCCVSLLTLADVGAVGTFFDAICILGAASTVFVAGDRRFILMSVKILVVLSFEFVVVASEISVKLVRGYECERKEARVTCTHWRNFTVGALGSLTYTLKRWCFLVKHCCVVLISL